MEALQELNSTVKEGHPIHTYLLETVLINQLLDEFESIDFRQEYQKFYNVFNHLSEIERRFERKENQLFPFLEQNGWDGPSRNMWTVHDRIRDEFRDARKIIEAKDFETIGAMVEKIILSIRQLLHIEETILFPRSLRFLTEEHWRTMSEGEEEIGWMLKEKPLSYGTTSEKKEKTRKGGLDITDKAHFDEGYMTVEQVNLLFRTLPLDITYVDENDKVVFYNRGEDRLFPRSPGVIGREVRYCHPPKSVDTVLQIVEAFRNGTQNEASFWINFKGRLILIRYFAVRDADKTYRGVMEMSQDITDLKTIEGERRLLAWKQ